MELESKSTSYKSLTSTMYAFFQNSKSFVSPISPFFSLLIFPFNYSQQEQQIDLLPQVYKYCIVSSHSHTSFSNEFDQTKCTKRKTFNIDFKHQQSTMEIQILESFFYPCYSFSPQPTIGIFFFLDSKRLNDFGRQKRSSHDKFHMNKNFKILFHINWKIISKVVDRLTNNPNYKHS